MARRSRNKNSTKKNKEGDSDLEPQVSSELDEEELKPTVDVQTESDASEGSPDDRAGEGDESNEGDKSEKNEKTDHFVCFWVAFLLQK